MLCRDLDPVVEQYLVSCFAFAVIVVQPLNANHRLGYPNASSSRHFGPLGNKGGAHQSTSAGPAFVARRFPIAADNIHIPSVKPRITGPLSPVAENASSPSEMVAVR
jgi:hypothetical protein